MIDNELLKRITEGNLVMLSMQSKMRLRTEYDLIQNKESQLSAQNRALVVHVVEKEIGRWV